MITYDLQITDRPSRVAPTISRMAAVPSAETGWSRRAEDRQLIQMQDAFARHGGMLTGDDVARAMRHRGSQPVAAIARWIVGREIVHLVRHSVIMLPMFQFDPVEFELRPGVRQTILELRDAFDDWDMCAWFATPNSWLDGEMPVERLMSDADSVVQAARADRFITLG
jgi:hypothetical protein